MVKIGGNYQAVDYSNYAAKNADKAESAAASQRAGAAAGSDGAYASRLSSAAQAYLEKLNRSYGNMEFFVADFDKGDTAESVLSRSTKEVSVILSSEELERMASDKQYEQKMMKNVQGALRMSEEINRRFGFQSAFGNQTGDVALSKIAISFHSDGTASIFAQLEKSSVAQRERIEEAREERRAEKKHGAGNKYKAEGAYGTEKGRGGRMKHTVVEAQSIDELMEKIAAVDWDKVKYDEREESGGRFDWSI